MAQTNYQQMLSDAQGSYSKILAGYNQALAGQQAAQQRVAGGYNTLSRQVLGGLAGSGRHRSQEIADFYTQRTGAANQDLINRGLGNTTVASSVGRGMAYDQSKAQTQLSGQLAGQAADYRSRIGLAGLGYQGQAIGQNTALLGQSLGYQADWQRSQLGAGMRGAEMEYHNAYSGRGGGGGGGFIGGSAAGTQYAPGFRGSMQKEPQVDDVIDLHEGMGGYGGWGRYGMNPGDSFIVNPAARPAAAPAYEGSQQYYDDVGSVYGMEF